MRRRNWIKSRRVHICICFSSPSISGCRLKSVRDTKLRFHIFSSIATAAHRDLWRSTNKTTKSSYWPKVRPPAGRRSMTNHELRIRQNKYTNSGYRRRRTSNSRKSLIYLRFFFRETFILPIMMSFCWRFNGHWSRPRRVFVFHGHHKQTEICILVDDGAKITPTGRQRI